MIPIKLIRKNLIICTLFILLLPIIFSTITQTKGVTYEVSFEELTHIASTGGDTFMCEVYDDLAIIIDMNSGLRTYNVSNPSNPVYLDYFYDGGIPHDFFVKDDLLYLADHHQGLEIYNISNPNDLVKIGQCADSGDGETDGVFVHENIAYTAEWHDSTWDWKLVLINVTNPFSPVKISEYVDGDNEFIRFYVKDEICYTACLNSGFKILNVTDPNSISEVSSFISGGYVFDLEIKDDIAFVSDGRLSIINISDLSNPYEISNYNPGIAVFDVKIQGQIAFLGIDEYGIQVVNISSLDGPTLLGEFLTDDIIGVEVLDDLIFLSQHEYGFRILRYTFIEVTNSANGSGIIFAFTITTCLSIVVIFRKKK